MTVMTRGEDGLVVVQAQEDLVGYRTVSSAVLRSAQVRGEQRLA